MTRSPSLSRLLYFHGVAFLLMLLLSGLAGGGLILVGNEVARQSQEMGRVVHGMERLRGDLYRQIKELFDYVFIGDHEALLQFEALDRDIEATLDSLLRVPVDASSAGQGSRLSQQIADLRQVYREVRQRVRAILNQPVSNFTPVEMMQVFEREFEQGEMMQYQRAMAASEALFDSVQQDLERRSRALLIGAALLLALPLFLGAALLFLSRRFLARSVVQPVEQLTRAVDELRGGEPIDRVPEAGPAELVRLQAAFNRMAGELERSQRARIVQEKQAAMGALVPVIAHNIRNPLSSVRAAAQVLLTPDLSEAARANLEGIIRAVDRVSEWLSSLLRYLHPVSLKSRATPLAEMVDDALLLHEHQLAERDIRVEPAAIAPDILVEADRGLLEQAIGNLLMNAIEASPRGGRIAIEAEAAAGTATLRILDRGEGLGEGAASGRSSKAGGFGLGLPLARKILELHGGSLVLAPRPAPDGARGATPGEGPGTAAIVTLPCVTAA